MRSAILGAVLAVVVLVTTVTFGASLNNLVSHPSLYGWNWNYAFLSGFAGQEDLPGPQVATLFNHDHYVAAWSGANFVEGQLDGHPVQMMTEAPRCSRGAADAVGSRVRRPPIRSSWATRHWRRSQAGRGHGHFSNGKTKSTTLTIVGTATMTPITKGLEMGTGALVATSDIPAALLNAQRVRFPAPKPYSFDSGRRPVQRRRFAASTRSSTS